jgi:hypothetical protein
VSGARISFPLHSKLVQHPHRPPERIRLHVRIGLRRQPDIRMPRQLLYRERVGSAVEQEGDVGASGRTSSPNTS